MACTPPRAASGLNKSPDDISPTERCWIARNPRGATLEFLSMMMLRWRSGKVEAVDSWRFSAAHASRPVAVDSVRSPRVVRLNDVAGQEYVRAAQSRYGSGAGRSAYHSAHVPFTQSSWLQALNVRHLARRPLPEKNLSCR